jgi:hypothetical protein
MPTTGRGKGRTPRPSRAPEAQSPDIHGAQTMIINRDTGKPAAAKPSPGKAEGKRGERRHHPGSPGGRDPKDLDPAIHDAPTLILRRK